MRYFITGATGFIGGYVARHLLAADHEIVVLARTPSKAAPLANLGATIVEGDITDKDSMRDAMAGTDGIFHIAAWYEVGTRDKSKAHAINVDGTRNVLELMAELNIPRGVYTSTIAVFSNTDGQLVDETYRYDGEHLSVYDKTKWLAHYEVALPMVDDGLPLTIVQPGIVYGPDDHSSVGDALRQYLRRILPVVPQGFGGCWSHVEDAARGHVLAMTKGQPGETYIIGGPPYTLREALETAKQITGVPLPLIKAPPVMLKIAAALMKPVAAVVPLPTTFAPESLRASAGVTYWASSAKATRELGWTTRPLEEGLRETLAYEMRKMGKTPNF